MEKNDSQLLARQLFSSEYQAVLSTLSVDIEGYPFGSVVPYCLNQKGLPVILISDIAQHTKNIMADPRVSLITQEHAADDQQAAGRVTLVGDAHRLDSTDTDSMSRYYTYFPHSRDYHKTHGFFFYSIQPVRIRFIGGFGRIHWLSPEDFIRSNPFNQEQEQQIVQHMNEDHADALKHYCELHGIRLTGDAQPVMAGIDAEGFHLRLGKAIYRIPFDHEVKNSGAARQALVDMARQPA